MIPPNVMTTTFVVIQDCCNVQSSVLGSDGSDKGICCAEMSLCVLVSYSTCCRFTGGGNEERQLDYT